MLSGVERIYEMATEKANTTEATFSREDRIKQLAEIEEVGIILVHQSIY